MGAKVIFINILEKMFTKSEAIEFLQNEWKMKDVKQQLQNDREDFLNKLIVTIHEKVPFQMLFLRNLAQVPPNVRKAPSVDEIERACMSGNGGNCSFINTFTSCLFNSLGYTTFLCRAMVTSHIFNLHVIIIVKDLVNAGDIHVVDCGLGLPSFRAISLNFNEESPVYQDSFLEYKFVKHGGKVLRMHGDGDVVVPKKHPTKGLDFISGKWRRFYEFTVETLQCNGSLEELGPFFLFKYLPMFSPRAAIFPGGKAILLDGNVLSLEQDAKTLKKIILNSREEIFQAFKTYFPTVDEDLVQEAYATWQISKL